MPQRRNQSSQDSSIDPRTRGYAKGMLLKQDHQDACCFMWPLWHRPPATESRNHKYSRHRRRHRRLFDPPSRPCRELIPSFCRHRYRLRLDHPPFIKHQWISSELEELKCRAQLEHLNLRIHIYTTQGSSDPPFSPNPADIGKKNTLDIGSTAVIASGSLISSLSKGVERENLDTTFMNSRHPSLHDIVLSFLESRAQSAYRTRVIASGPRSM